jgi:hypothetical protein
MAAARTRERRQLPRADSRRTRQGSGAADHGRGRGALCGRRRARQTGGLCAGQRCWQTCGQSTALLRALQQTQNLRHRDRQPASARKICQRPLQCLHVLGDRRVGVEVRLRRDQRLRSALLLRDRREGLTDSADASPGRHPSSSPPSRPSSPPNWPHMDPARRSPRPRRRRPRTRPAVPDGQILVAGSSMSSLRRQGDIMRLGAPPEPIQQPNPQRNASQ